MFFSAPDSDTIVALYNYGGGMRGLIPAHIMAAMESKTGLHMVDMVDAFMGPSTGAILNAALTLPHHTDPKRPRFRAEQMVRFYEHQGLRIFPPDSFREFRGFLHDFNNRTMKLGQLNRLLRHGHYDPVPLGRSLRALYGNSRLADSLASLFISTYNIDGEQIYALADADEDDDTPVNRHNNYMDEGGHALWMKNIKIAGARNYHPPPDVSLWDAVMASTAAPTFFPSHHFEIAYPETGMRQYVSGIDGNIFDNPCVAYMGALRQHIPKDKNVIMIVLGTGWFNRSIKHEDWNRYGALGVVDPVNNLPLINIFFHASESALMDSYADEIGRDLYTFNKSILSAEKDIAPNVQIDDAGPDNLKRMRSFADAIIEENQRQFDAICNLLTKHADNKKRAARRSQQSFFSRLRGQ